MNKYRKLCSDTLVYSLGSFGSKILVFLLMPLYTALLTPSEYGIADLIFSTANLLMPFACIGITNGIFRFTADRNCSAEEKRAVFSCGACLLGIGLLFFLLVGFPIILFGSRKSEAWLVLLFVLTADLQAVFAQFVRALDQTKLFAVQGIFNTVFTVLLNLLFLAVFHLGVNGYVLSVILSNFVTAGFLFFKAKLYRYFSLRDISKGKMKELAFFSVPMIPTSVCWLITALSDRYLVTYFCGSEVNGIYSAAYKIPSIVNLAASVFLQAWQFSAVSESGDERACADFYSKVFRNYLALIFSATAALIFFSPLLSKLLLNRAFWSAVEVMPILLTASCVEAIVAFFASVYLIRKKSVNSLLTAMSGALLNLILNWLMIPTLGSFGAALATLAGYGLVYFLRLADVKRYLVFEMSEAKQALSFLFLVAEATTVNSNLILSGLCAVLTVAIHFPVLRNSVKSLLSYRSVWQR